MNNKDHHVGQLTSESGESGEPLDSDHSGESGGLCKSCGSVESGGSGE